MNRTKRIVFLSDLHCGSLVGLTDNPKNSIQRKLLDHWMECVERYKKPDILVVNGDCIDGKQEKSGGRGQSTVQMTEQVEMAVSLLKMWDAAEIVIVGGTEYHVGVDDWEKVITSRLDGSVFRDKAQIEVNSWFDIQVRHYITSAKKPEGRATPSLGEMSSEIMNAYYEGKKASDLIVNGHVHYYMKVENAFGTAITLPCWQAKGSVYGKKKCSGHTDLGCVVVTVGKTPEEGWSCEKYLFFVREKADKLKF